MIDTKGNTGNWNTGNLNTGNWNTGDRNTGNWNTGNWNTGDRNTGNWNTGDRNTGNLNTGNWNTGDRNTGIFNTDEPKMRAFNFPCGLTHAEFVNKHGYCPLDILLTEWIYASKMTAEEKAAHPEFGNTDGYLKKHEFKNAFARAWKDATAEQKKWFTDLPNFNADIFFEVTGVDVRTVAPASLSGKKISVKIDGAEYSATID